MVLEANAMRTIKTRMLKGKGNERRSVWSKEVEWECGPANLVSLVAIEML